MPDDEPKQTRTPTQLAEMKALPTVNDLVYKIIERVKVLANHSMVELRIATASENCHSLHTMLKENKHLSRGELIELILEQEFIEEYPKYITEGEEL